MQFVEFRPLGFWQLVVVHQIIEFATADGQRRAFDLGDLSLLAIDHGPGLGLSQPGGLPGMTQLAAETLTIRLRGLRQPGYLPVVPVARLRRRKSKWRECITDG